MEKRDQSLTGAGHLSGDDYGRACRKLSSARAALEVALNEVHHPGACRDERGIDIAEYLQAAIARGAPPRPAAAIGNAVEIAAFADPQPTAREARLAAALSGLLECVETAGWQTTDWEPTFDNARAVLADAPVASEPAVAELIAAARLLDDTANEPNGHPEGWVYAMTKASDRVRAALSALEGRT